MRVEGPVKVETSGQEDIGQNQLGVDSEDSKDSQISRLYDCGLSAFSQDGHAVDEGMLQNLETALNELRDKQGWKEITVRPGSEIFHSQMIWQPVRMLGRIEQVKGPRPVANFEDLTYSGMSLVVMAVDGTRMETTTFPVEHFVEDCDLMRLASRQKSVLFCGALIPVRKRGGKDSFHFYLKEVIPTPAPAELFPMRLDPPDSGNHPAMIVREHSEFNGVVKFIKARLVDRLGILGLDYANGLSKALEAVILQAFSQGKEVYSHRLHLLVIGPPGVGKSFLTKSALRLNGRSEEVSSVAAKITAAGLIGKVRNQSGKSISCSGILPRNSGGVVCIQDFHHIHDKTRNQVCTIFSQLMEDGEVTDSTSSSVTLEAETALLLDMNRKSHIDPKGTYDAFSDIDIPVNVLTRFDFISEIERDELRQTELAREIILNPQGRGGNGLLEADGRPIRDVITWMKQEYSHTNPRSKEVNDHVLRRAEEVLGEFRKRVMNPQLWEDFQTRLARSIDKLLRAIATANGSRDITLEMVDYAFQFIRPKLEFLCKIGEVESAQVGNRARTREDFVRGLLQNGPLGIREIEVELKKRYPDDEISGKTVQRVLRKTGAKFVSRSKKWKLK